MPDTLDGYVADSLYPSSFHQAFAPPWTDALLRHSGVVPPRQPRGPFTLVDLGCGDGLGLILNAAAHPEAQFVGIDAMPDHIARGQAVVAKLGLSNVELRCETFQKALTHAELGVADYVTCQGVLAWVSEANRAALLDLAARLLRVGGVLTIGYNCQPGWGAIAPFQRAVRALAADIQGSPSERFETAIIRLRASGAIQQAVWDWFDPQIEFLPRDYFAHEYLNAHWNPLWAEDAVRAMRARGMHFVAEAKPSRLRPDFGLKKVWRDTLEGISDEASRESALDVFTNNWFRTDIYVKGQPAALEADARTEGQLSPWWASTCAAADVIYEARTSAGTIKFGNDAARAIMATLDDGPQPLGNVAGIGAADLLNSIDALFVAAHVRPVDPPAEVPLAEAVNQLAKGGSETAINGRVSRHGAMAVGRDPAVAINDATLRRLGITAYVD